MDDDDEEINNNIVSLIDCSICHKKKFDIVKNKCKKYKVFEKLNKSEDLSVSELIRKCNCKKNKEYIYSHKYCLLLKILFNYEIKCEKCNTEYNIKIDKKLDKGRLFYIFIIFLFTYIMHLFLYLFCIFLFLFNVLIKEYAKTEYKHLFIIFGIILFFFNTIFLYLSIINNIQLFKIQIYDYKIEILDYDNDNKKYNILINEEKDKKYSLISEFFEWVHFQSIKHLLIDMNKKYFFNKIYSSKINSINEIINQSNQSKKGTNKCSLKNELKNNDQSINIFNNIKNENNNNNLHLKSDFNNLNNNNPKFLSLYNLYNNKDEINFSSSNNENSNNNLNNINISNQNFIRKSSNVLNCTSKLSHTFQDFINININPKTSKNINININLCKDKNSQLEQHSSSKEITLKSGRILSTRNGKIGKTALIPKKYMMTNIMHETNFFKRKRRQLQSIKLRGNRLNLKNTQIGGNIDEEIDFSSFDNIRSKISRESKNNQNIFSPSIENNDYIGFQYSSFQKKKSFRDVPLCISNSDIEEVNVSKEQNMGNSIKSNNSKKNMVFGHVGGVD